MWLRLCILFLSVTLFTRGYAASKQQVLLLTYHFKAPYVIDWAEQRGLYFDLALYLNSKTEQYQFSTELIPRKRLDALLAGPFTDVVVGVQPLWFQSVADKMVFTEPFLHDQDMFVSAAEKPFMATNVTDFTGKTFIGSQGYRYNALDQAVAAGTLKRVDTLQEDYVLDMLRLGRGDFTIISSSTLSYKFNHGEQAQDFYVAPSPHEVIWRRFMLTNNDPRLYQFLQQAVVTMSSDPKWQQLLGKYHIQQALVKH